METPKRPITVAESSQFHKKNHYIAHKKWRLKNPEQVKAERKRRWQRQKNDPIWLKQHNEDSTKRSIIRAAKNRKMLIEILGGKCSCVNLLCPCEGKCNITAESILTFDHKNGDGYKDKIKVLVNYARIPELAKEVLQLMCANCHLFKTKINRENETSWKR